MPRFNYTGRKKIKRHDIEIITFTTNGVYCFNANINLDSYKLPEDALVFIEAYRQTSWMRFPFGTTGNIASLDNTFLHEFDNLDGVLFRVKVSKTGDTHGKLLAAADRIKPISPEKKESGREGILPVKSEDNMNCIWKLDFTNEEPILLINSRAGGRDELGKSQEFISLVYPSVLREILTYIVNDPPDENAESDDDIWKIKWLKYVSLIPGMGNQPDFAHDSEIVNKQWIEDAIDAFSRKLNLVDNFASYWQNRDRA